MSTKFINPPTKELANIAINDHLKRIIYKEYPMNDTTKAITITPKDNIDQETIKELDKYLKRTYTKGYFYTLETPEGMYKQDAYLKDHKNRDYNNLLDAFKYHIHLVVNSDFSEEMIQKKFSKKYKDMNIHVQDTTSIGVLNYSIKQLDNMMKVHDAFKLQKEGIVFNYRFPSN